MPESEFKCRSGGSSKGLEDLPKKKVEAGLPEPWLATQDFKSHSMLAASQATARESI